MICIETRQTKIYLSKGTDYSDTLFAYIDYVIGLAIKIALTAVLREGP